MRQRLHRARAPRDFTLDDPRWQAVLTRDASWDGRLVFAVTSTGVFCRPSCPARRPKPENARLYGTPEQARAAGFRPCKRCMLRLPVVLRAELVRKVCQYIESHLDEPITLSVLSEWTGVSPFHLQRTFKTVAGLSPKQYLDACRLLTFKREVRAGRSVLEAQLEAGYGSSSRLYEKTHDGLGMTPTAYVQGGQGIRLRYTVVGSPLGWMLVGATDRGLCNVQFGDAEEELVSKLAREYPRARLERDDVGLGGWVQALLRYLEGSSSLPALPPCALATAFQRRIHEKPLPVGPREGVLRFSARKSAGPDLVPLSRQATRHSADRTRRSRGPATRGDRPRSTRSHP